MNKNIVIVGYPKSGTTWLSRLVAQLVDCPLKGDWGFENLKAPYQEGLKRDSNYQVFKSHHTFNNINTASSLKLDKIIYIVRDPRDVVISGMHYFNFLPKFLIRKGNRIKINKFYKKGYFKLTSKKEKRRQMIEAVLHGNDSINPWLSGSWLDHLSSFANQNICLIKYENLIENPVRECVKILNYFDLEINNEHIIQCIIDQSFNSRKKKDKNKKDPHQSKILRKGESGNWEKELTLEDIHQFKTVLKDKTDFYTF